MAVTTRKAKLGKSYCRCGGDFITCEEDNVYIPRNGGEQIKYTIEFQLCDSCGEDIVLTRSIIKNEKRLKQAKLEATVAYKMKKWILSNQNS